MNCGGANNSSLNSMRRTFHNVAAIHILLFYLLISGGLFASPTDAAPRNTTFGSIFHDRVCLESSFNKTLTSNRTQLPPPPDPPPLALGCLIPGCQLASSGPLELRIEIYGDAVESATLDIDAVSPYTMGSLDFNGEPVVALEQLGRFKIGKGATQISGFPLSNIQIPILATKLSEVLRDQPSPLSIPTAHFRLTLDQAIMHRLASQARETLARPGTELGRVDLSAQVWSKKTLVNQVTGHYSIVLCLPYEHDRGDPPIDQIHLTDQQGTTVQDFSDDAVALANGRTSAGWVQPDAFRSKSFFPMPNNMLNDDGTCTQTNSAVNPESCTAEVAIFTKNHGMTMVLNPTWTFGLGDIVPASIKSTTPDLITIPIDFYILWEHRDATGSEINPNPLPAGTPCPTVPATSECMLENWLTEANMIYERKFSGIRFMKRNVTTTLTTDLSLLHAGCSDLNPIYSHFQVPDMVNPTAIHMFLVMVSHDAASNKDGSGWTCTSTPYSTWYIGSTYYNEVFISVSHANATTLTHELGHTLSLEDVNVTNSDGSVSPQVGACVSPSMTRPNVTCLTQNNLMWSGSLLRSGLTKGQSFRANVNEKSAVFRHDRPGKVLGLVSRLCEDFVDNITCPSLTLDQP